MTQSHDSSVNDTNRAVVSDAILAVVSDTATAQIIYYRFSHVFSIKKTSSYWGSLFLGNLHMSILQAGYNSHQAMPAPQMPGWQRRSIDHFSPPKSVQFAHWNGINLPLKYPLVI